MARSLSTNKRPRGIRFTDEGYDRLRDALKASDHTHYDDYILDLIKGSRNKVKIEALIRKLSDTIEASEKRVLDGVEGLLEKYTNPEG